jgi:hypothetical protein
MFFNVFEIRLGSADDVTAAVLAGMPKKSSIALCS